MASEPPSAVVPNSKKRRRSSKTWDESGPGERKRSSNSHSSSVELTTSCRPGIIATATTVSSSKSSARVQTAIAMATVLASELRPEHKLPSREILVKPMPRFMKLLETVGASSGQVFTARQVLSYLIKYISSRQLYVPHDPKRIYCEKDPLGAVFGVSTFTIKDARKLLFENMSVLREAPDFVTQHDDSFQRQQRKFYYTFHQSQQTTDVTKPTTSASHAMPSATPDDSQVGTTSSLLLNLKGNADSSSKGTLADFAADDQSSGGKKSQKSHPVASMCSLATDDSNPAKKIKLQNSTSTAVETHKIHVIGNATESKQSSSFPVKTSIGNINIATETITASVPNTQHQSNRKRKKSRRISESSDDCVQIIARGKKSTSLSGSDQLSSRPWYCMLYHPSEELNSQSSEVLSIQDCETAIAADSSDDLWFVNEDDFIPVEYEVQSDSSDDYNRCTSEESSCGTEMVYNILVQPEESGDSHFADNSEEDTTDTEISDLDRWECMECSMRNSPFKRYCSRCWALRKGWLPDDQRMTLKERLQNANRPLTRSFSAPAGHKPPSPRLHGVRMDNENIPELDVKFTVVDKFDPQQPVRKDYADGFHFESKLTSSSLANTVGYDSQDCGNDDEAGTGIKQSPEERNSKIRENDLADNSQDTVIISQSSSKSVTPVEADKSLLTSNMMFQLESRDDSGIGLTQESVTINTSSEFSTVKLQVPPKRKFNPSDLPEKHCRKRQRSTSGSDATILKSEKSQITKMPFQFSSPSAHQLGLGSAPSSDVGAGPSSSQASSIVTKHYNDLCIICYARPKTASIIHGRTGHQVCCYPCAKKLYHRGKPCPVCRRSIQAVIKNFLL